MTQQFRLPAIVIAFLLIIFFSTAFGVELGEQKMPEFGPAGVPSEVQRQVVEELNAALRDELTAINQYFLHAEMTRNWGYNRLYARTKKRAINEMKHAEALIERILFLGGKPAMEPLKLNMGSNVKEILENDYAAEVGASKLYNEAIERVRKAGDNTSRQLLEANLKDEQEHIDWLDAQLHLIQEIGYERYLIVQLEDGSSD